MALRRIAGPASEPVTLTEAKAHLRVDHSDDDTLIGALIAAAREYVEQFLGRVLVDQTWELVFDEFPDNEIQIPKPPLIEVVSVKYDDTAGDEQTIDPGDYSVDNVSEPGWVLPQSSGSWPSTFDGINAVRIRFRAGYVDSSSPSGEVPGDIKAGLLLLLGSLYEHRETQVIGQTAVLLPWSAEQLLRPKRVQLGMA